MTEGAPKAEPTGSEGSSDGAATEGSGSSDGAATEGSGSSDGASTEGSGSSDGAGSEGSAGSALAVDPELLAALALTLLAFAEGARVIGVHWFEASGYYGHGPLVVAVCVWLVWRDRDRLAAAPRGSTALGFGLLVLALWVNAVGILERVGTLPRYGLLVALLGVALVLHGVTRCRGAWFPWLYAALFAVPLPKPLLNAATLDLKLRVARWTHGLVEFLGYGAILRGDAIHFSGGRAVFVDDLCSGLRSLITLVALACLFAILQRARWKAGLMLVLAVPIALLANVARTLTLCLLAARGTPAPADGWLHEATGLLIYAAALGLLFALQALPEAEHPGPASSGDPAPEGEPGDGPAERVEGEPGDGSAERVEGEPEDAPAAGVEGEPGDAPAAGVEGEPGDASGARCEGARARAPGGSSGRPPSRGRVRALYALLGAGSLVNLGLMLGASAPAPDTRRTAELPLAAGPWTGQDFPLSEAELTSLDSRDALRRRFRRDNDRIAVELFVLHSPRAEIGIHDPHACYTLQGFVELARGQEVLRVGERELAVNRALISLGGRRHLVYFWFRLNGDPFSEHAALRTAKLLHRAAGFRGSQGSTIRISTPLSDGEAAGEARLKAFAAEALGQVLSPLRQP